MERDLCSINNDLPINISTHTLTWSVTVSAKKVKQNSRISTHTLTWSVTLGYYMLYYRYSNFNSHAHVERDNYVNLARAVVLNFNSHAHVERDT